MTRTSAAWSLLGRAARWAAAVSSALSLFDCTCPPPVTVDDIFLLDATPGSPPEDADGGALTENGADSADAAAPASLDCTPATSSCHPGGSCPPACDCVLARDHVRFLKVVDCRLLDDSEHPQVEARYQQAVFCGGD
jgi:hypothetical protein